MVATREQFGGEMTCGHSAGTLACMSATEEQMFPSRITARLFAWLAPLLFLFAALAAVPVSATASAKALCVPQNRIGEHSAADAFTFSLSNRAIGPEEMKFYEQMQKGSAAAAYANPVGQTVGMIDPAAIVKGVATRVAEKVGAKEVENVSEKAPGILNKIGGWIKQLLGKTEEEGAASAKHWGEPVTVNNRRVYRRNDLFDPNKTDASGATNLQRMQRGQPPIGDDGRPIVLHHLIQQEPGPMAEVGGKFHSANTKTLHGLVGGKSSFRYSPSGKMTQAEKTFKRWSYGYWRQRASEIGQ